MFRRMLVVYGTIIFFAATAYVVEGVTRCWPKCGSDVVTVPFKSSKGDETVDDHSESPEATDIVTVCLNPQGRYVFGNPPRERGITGTAKSGSAMCQQKIQGKCIVDVKIPTQNTDINPETGEPFTQAEFEEFWGIQDACNNQYTAIYVWQIHSVNTICIKNPDGEVKKTIVATCTYPKVDANGDPELQVKRDRGGRFVEFIKVVADCPIIMETEGAAEGTACAP
jgi:hypothetical protein